MAGVRTRQDEEFAFDSDVNIVTCLTEETAMLCATLIGMIERTQFRPNQRLLCSAMLLLAVVYVTMPYLSHPH